MNKRLTLDRGFTLIELMTALSIFTIVVAVSLGSIVAVFNASRKARSLKAVVSNLNLAIEDLSKEMRYGSHYHCGSSGSQTTPQNCSSGDTYISFLSSDNVQISYRLNGTTFERQEGISGDWLPLIAPEVTIDNITFYVLGASAADLLQPKMIMKIQAHAGSGTGRSDLSIETMVSQRRTDS